MLNIATISMNPRLPSLDHAQTVQHQKQRPSYSSSSQLSLMSWNLPPSTRHQEKKTRLPDDFTPNPYSVLIGRGKQCVEAIGNRRLKITVSRYIEEYSNAPTRIEKSTIVSRIVDIFHDAAPIGSFIKQENGVWWQVSDSTARERVGTMLRDALHNAYRSSSKAKLARRRGSKEIIKDTDTTKAANFMHSKNQKKASITKRVKSKKVVTEKLAGAANRANTQTKKRPGQDQLLVKGNRQDDVERLDIADVLSPGQPPSSGTDTRQKKSSNPSDKSRAIFKPSTSARKPRKISMYDEWAMEMAQHSLSIANATDLERLDPYPLHSPHQQEHRCSQLVIEEEMPWAQVVGERANDSVFTSTASPEQQHQQPQRTFNIDHSLSSFRPYSDASLDGGVSSRGDTTAAPVGMEAYMRQLGRMNFRSQQVLALHNSLENSDQSSMFLLAEAASNSFFKAPPA